ncbi:uroporphyrinogen-III synthase [Paenibacillus konkukensis]|uniref:Uroporphyrinogen-III synthase n=1 Tax=Paenibacillus konkukensis TaxID=2020716 RepID=A0ABY4RV77_9BACL|nr:uroporphyrinogen-III synthase [Paenibacillus konkukensis]UQZ85913.1 uroporphyrinogen-III synthase [Paenibacillus konkukensis]
MRRLEGKRIAITGPRKAAELSVIVEKLGGIPLVRPAQGTVAVEKELTEAKIRRLIDEGGDWIVFTTGVGAEMLYKTAEDMGEADAFVGRLKRMKLAVRGYKTVKYLKTLGLAPTVRDDDGTTIGIVRALQPYSMRGQRVVLQLYGDHAPRLVNWLEEQQADYYEILPYRHVPPELDVVNTLLAEITQGQVDAVTFTSTPQVRFLMAYAREHGLEAKLLEAFRTCTVAVAVGKVTAEALRDEGIERVVAPEEERMGSMIVTLAQYYER